MSVANAFATQTKSTHRATLVKDSVFPSPLLQLREQIEAARKAQQAGDPQAVAEANRKLIGLALQSAAGIAQLHSDMTQAVSMYRQSLEFDDNADTHLELAIAYLRVGSAEDAVAQSEKAVKARPQSSQAWHVQGKALMMRHDYAEAVQSLGHAVSLRSDMEAAYSMGICFLELQEKAKAAAVFRQMIELGGDRPNFHALFGRAYQDHGLYEEAIREYEQTIRLDPKTPHIHYFLGLVSIIRNSWIPNADARREFLLEASQYPRDFFGNYFSGFIASGDRNYEKANRYLRIAAEAQPSWPEPWMMLGLNARDEGKPEEAEKLLRKAILLTGKDDARNRYQIRRAYFALGRLLVESGRREEGRQALQYAGMLQAKALTQSREGVAEQAAMAGNMGGSAVGLVDLPDAAPLPRGGSPKDSNSTEDLDADEPSKRLSAKEAEQLGIHEEQLHGILGSAFNDLATAEARQRDYEQALAHYRQAAYWAPGTPLLMRNLGLAAARANDFQAAAGPLQKALEVQPDDNLVRCMLGLTLFTLENYRGSVEVFSRAGDAIYNEPGLAYAYASSLSKSNRAQEAAKILNQLERRPLAPEMLLLIGQVWSEIADYAHAIRTLHQALEGDPSLRKAHYYSGLAYMRSDQPLEAEGELRAELMLAPEDFDAKYDLAYALLQLEKKGEALELLKAVVSVNPRHADAHYQLGKVLFESGQVKEAIGHLEAAAHLNPQLDYVHYQLQAAYRKDARLADADRELRLYREMKAHNRDRTLPVPE